MTRLRGPARWQRMKRTSGCCMVVLLVLGAVVACGRGSEPKPQPQPQPTAGVPLPIAERIGWLHGPCLAIANPKLAGGTPLTLVLTGEPQTVQQARIGERTVSPERCQALKEGRAAVNAKPGVFFYTLEAGSLDATAMGFGVVPPPAQPEIVSGLARVDLDQNGRREVFSSCATTEGIKFAVWADKAYEGEPRWAAYYYLDYESPPTCP